MSVEVVDDLADMFDGRINADQPIEWDITGSGCREWNRFETYRAGECVLLPNREIWCAKRNVRAGEVTPGEVGWKHVWTRRSEVLGTDFARYAMEQQRFHGRGGVSVGADFARYSMEQQRFHGRGGVSVGEDAAAEAAHNQRFHGRGGVRVGAYVADFYSLDGEADPNGDYEEITGVDPAVAKASSDTKKIVERARDMKTPAQPPAQVVEFDEMDYLDINPTTDEILGAYEEIDDQNFPVTAKLYRHFKGAVDPKYVRLDTEESYRDFRADQSPEIAALRVKVAALEALVRAHMQDGHGAESTILGLASDVSKLQAASNDKRVPLQMPPWVEEGTWDCWHEDGPEGGLVCCSIALPGHDGTVRMCTSATPVKKHVEDVVEYTNDVGCDVVGLLGVLPTIACMLAGRDVMTAMAAAAPQVLAHPKARGDAPFVGRIIPANHPTRATLIALLQAAQAGDPKASREWSALASLADSNAELASSMIAARDRLAHAQTVVSGVRGWSNR